LKTIGPAVVKDLAEATRKLSMIIGSEDDVLNSKAQAMINQVTVYSTDWLTKPHTVPKLVRFNEYLATFLQAASTYATIHTAITKLNRVQGLTTGMVALDAARKSWSQMLDLGSKIESLVEREPETLGNAPLPNTHADFARTVKALHDKLVDHVKWIAGNIKTAMHPDITNSNVEAIVRVLDNAPEVYDQAVDSMNHMGIDLNDPLIKGKGEWGPNSHWKEFVHVSLGSTGRQSDLKDQLLDIDVKAAALQSAPDSQVGSLTSSLRKASQGVLEKVDAVISGYEHALAALQAGHEIGSRDPARAIYAERAAESITNVSNALKTLRNTRSLFVKGNLNTAVNNLAGYAAVLQRLGFVSSEKDNPVRFKTDLASLLTQVQIHGHASLVGSQTTSAMNDVIHVIKQLLSINHDVSVTSNDLSFAARERDGSLPPDPYFYSKIGPELRYDPLDIDYGVSPYHSQ
jgi:hypothetical protein